MAIDNLVDNRPQAYPQLAVDLIHMHEDAQPREGLDPDHLEDLINVLLDGRKFKDAVVVFYDETNYWLADGFHRVTATKTVGFVSIDADIRPGTLDDAIEYSCGANATHGLKRTKGDIKRSIIRLVTLLPKWMERTQAEIADHCNCDQSTVSKVLKELNYDSHKNPTNPPVEPVEEVEEVGNFPTNADKRNRVKEILSESPELSDREIARRCGVDHKTVSAVRKELYPEPVGEPTPEPEPIEAIADPVTAMDTPATLDDTEDDEDHDYGDEEDEEDYYYWDPNHKEDEEVEDITEPASEPAQPIEEHTVVTPEPEPEPVEDTDTPEVESATSGQVPATTESEPEPSIETREAQFDAYLERKRKQEEKERAREQRREENRQEIASAKTIEEALGTAKFSTIVIDPPWDWGDEGDVDQFGRAKPTYGTMSIDELLELPVGTYADVDSHLYLWITNRSLPKGFQLLEKWGFRYVTCITWVKPNFGMGNYFRGQTEHLLFGVKGSQMLKRKNVGTVFEAPRGPKGHSSKPIEVYDLIESCSPGPYLEIFARSERTDWRSWGAEV